MIKNCVVNSIIKIFNNELPIIWSDKQGNWIKVSSLPNEIKNKINIFKQNTRIKYVSLRLVLKTIIQILKEDMEINDRFLDNELEEIIVGLCSRKNIEISHFFPINHNNYESGVAKIINLLSRKIDYHHRFTGFSAHSLSSETKRIYYVLNFYLFRNEILRTIENAENDRKFYNYVCSLSDQKLHNIFSYFLKQIVLFYCGDFSFQYLDGVDDFTVIDEIDAIFVNINKIIN